MAKFLSFTSGLCTVALIAFGGNSAHAQTNAEIFAGIQFNFSTPGARSLALGGAFIGLADDATAAFANPAGLTILSKPEISFEYRSFDYTHRFTDRGRAFGEPSTGVDDTPRLVSGESSTEVDSISMLSLVYPKKKFSFAVYRHESANFEASFRTQGPFFERESGQTRRFFPVMADMSLEIINYGLSTGFKLGKDFSLGLGVSYYEFDLDSRTDRFDVINGFREPPDYSPSNIVNFQEEAGSDDDTTIIFGFLWDLSERWSLGGVYRQGPEFTFNSRNTSGPSRQNEGILFADQTARFNVPDVYGLGFAFRATDAITLSFDYDHVEYSSLTEDVLYIFLNPEDNPVSPPAMSASPEQIAAARKIAIDDADEFHFGFEYVFFKLKNPIALRLGSWYDPDHRARFKGQPNNDAERSEFINFQPGSDEIHYSVGIGIVFKDKFQLDAAADFSDLIDTVSLSGVLRF